MDGRLRASTKVLKDTIVGAKRELAAKKIRPEVDHTPAGGSGFDLASIATF
jgi:hypothetical protein